MNDKISSAIKYYTLCTKLKDTIRTGPIVWKATRHRLESVAEHIYGTQMLAIGIYYQFAYELDLAKILFMLAVHELEEIEIGDLAFFQITEENKLIEGRKATDFILKDLLGKDQIKNLLEEYNARETDEAKFAYHCDKLECNLQMKLYDQEGCFDLSDQAINPIIENPKVKEVLDSENSISDAWIEFDRNKYKDDENFLAIVDYLKKHDI